MPTFENVTVITTADIDFEVYCNTCGSGLCSESIAVNTRNRGELSVRVNACPYCMAEKDKEIKELNSKVENLKNQIDKLENEIANYEQ